MITMARVDDRLIHGQVAVKWSKELNISRIIVASDSIAKNAVQVAALKGAAPSGVKAAILTIEKAQNILNDPRSKDMRILLVSNDPRDISRSSRASRNARSSTSPTTAASTARSAARRRSRTPSISPMTTRWPSRRSPRWVSRSSISRSLRTTARTS